MMRWARFKNSNLKMLLFATKPASTAAIFLLLSIALSPLMRLSAIHGRHYLRFCAWVQSILDSRFTVSLHSAVYITALSRCGVWRRYRRHRRPCCRKLVGIAALLLPTPATHSHWRPERSVLYNAFQSVLGTLYFVAYCKCISGSTTTS